MDIDITQHLGAVTREVAHGERAGQRTAIVRASRTYATDQDDLWSALTDPERLPRWFAPVTGDLRLGGRFQVEGNAGGEVLACDAPDRFEITWEFDGGVSWVEVRLAPDPAGGTRLTLEHSAIPGGEHWDTYGPGAVGIGWELSLMGMELHVASGGAAGAAEGQAWAISPEAAEFMVGSGTAWGDADAASGTDPAEARAKAERTNAAYTAAPEA
jgi:uncharacterized protein YndB with AHSA1/START domain